jgi:hypothetical protein
MSGTMDPAPEGKLLMTTAPIYPQADPWTFDDLDRLPDGPHYEIIDGSLIVSAPPTPLHQLAAVRLVHQIGQDTGSGAPSRSSPSFIDSTRSA